MTIDARIENLTENQEGSKSGSTNWKRAEGRSRNDRKDKRRPAKAGELILLATNALVS